MSSQKTKRQKDKKTKRQKRQKKTKEKKKDQKTKKEFDIVMSGQFRTLAMFCFTTVLPL